MLPGIKILRCFLPIKSLTLLRTLFYQRDQSRPTSMENHLRTMKSDARRIFKAGVDAVLPQKLINRWLQLEDDQRLMIGEKMYNVNDNVYLVGFGKAVAAMARSVQEILGHHLVKGIISVPLGTVEVMEKTGRKEMLPKGDGKITIKEGAKNNLPDKPAYQTALDIVSLLSRLCHDDLLIILISGGGSALLPLPVLPVSLEEKQLVIKRLSTRGATVQELNSVRKRLSRVKGGGLAKLSRPAQVAALILSDIVGDPIDLIASGPTVRNTDPAGLPLKILKKYNLLQEVPNTVLEVLNEYKRDSNELDNFDHVYNLLIGTNSLAIETALNEARALGYTAVSLTSQLTGVARDVGETLAKLSVALINKDTDTLKGCAEILHVPLSVFEHLISQNRRICVICGGETTVLVKGSGLGGRNQEMALTAAITLSSAGVGDKIMFLSAGTDGIDGPTPAAGAFGYAALIAKAMEKGMEVSKYLDDNNSFAFYDSLNAGADFIMTGHTGTNVMDLQVILIGLS